MTKLISFYGDDFTGSTDVMEALSTHGVDTVLFTRIPTEEEFAPFATHQAIGLAGTSRSQTPEWMDENLPAVFAWLKSLNAKFCHYKVCSTFDSSPKIGNIGRATEIGARAFAQAVIPLIVGAPQLKRYTFAGHLFAGYQGETFRIDRHPVMAQHPVTPMHEADLRLHLAKQTQVTTMLANDSWPTDGLALIDVYDAATQFDAGNRLIDAPASALPFFVGSSGVEYALVKALTAAGEISGTAQFSKLEKVEQCIVVSGSVSPTTARQIQTASQQGFEQVSLSPVALAKDNGAQVSGAIETCLQILSAGRSPLVHTAHGAATDEGAQLDTIPDSRKSIGVALGNILRAVLERTDLTRAIIAGGDSSSHALGQLDIYALKTRFPLSSTPGSPLCTATSSNSKLNGLEIAMKGGQVGSDTYFVQLRDGVEV
jgi:3-oxoisoapionate kinase